MKPLKLPSERVDMPARPASRPEGFLVACNRTRNKDDATLLLLAGGMQDKTDTGPNALGKRLRQLREARRWSLRDASRLLDISFSRLADYETGWTHGTNRPALPKRDLLMKAAEVYEYPAEMLLRLAGMPLAESIVAYLPAEGDADAAEVYETCRRLPDSMRRILVQTSRTLKVEADLLSASTQGETHPET